MVIIISTSTKTVLLFVCLFTHQVAASPPWRAYGASPELESPTCWPLSKPVRSWQAPSFSSSFSGIAGDLWLTSSDPDSRWRGWRLRRWRRYNPLKARTGTQCTRSASHLGESEKEGKNIFETERRMAITSFAHYNTTSKSKSPLTQSPSMAKIYDWKWVVFFITLRPSKKMF